MEPIADSRSRLERFLSVFADVRAGEGARIVALAGVSSELKAQR